MPAEAYSVWETVTGRMRNVDPKKELKRALEKAYLYGLLAEYYKYRDTELSIHYNKKHDKYARKVVGKTWSMEAE